MADLRPIRFAPQLIPLIKSGVKTLTYRLGPDYADLQPGTLLRVLESRSNRAGPLIRVTGVTTVKFADVPLTTRGHERYRTRAEMRDIFEGYYQRGVSADEPVTVLRFETVKP